VVSPSPYQIDLARRPKAGGLAFQNMRWSPNVLNGCTRSARSPLKCQRLLFCVCATMVWRELFFWSKVVWKWWGLMNELGINDAHYSSIAER